MKRATKHKCGNGPFCPWCRDEAKTTEQQKHAAKLKRQAAELRRLRAVERAAVAVVDSWFDNGSPGHTERACQVLHAALKPARRKP